MITLDRVEAKIDAIASAMLIFSQALEANRLQCNRESEAGLTLQAWLIGRSLKADARVDSKLDAVLDGQAKLLAALNAIEERMGELEMRVGRSIEDILRIDQKIFFARKPPTALSSGKQGKAATKKKRK